MIALVVVVATVSAVVIFVGAARGVGIDMVDVVLFLGEVVVLFFGAIIMASGLVHVRRFARAHISSSPLHGGRH